MSLTRVLSLIVVGVLGFVGLTSLGCVVENVDSDEIVVIQDAVDGELHWYTTAGVKPQFWGKVTSYPKRSIYEFETQVRFNDGGHGIMKGSIQYEMPLDEENLTALHTRFGSPTAIQQQLIEKVATKSVYMTGPLMSSRESYAEKRNYLINYVEDQIANGVYRTVQREVRVTDPLTQQEKSAVVVEIVLQGGQPARQEEAVLTEFGIKPFNFAISQLEYDAQVEAQISEQQKIAMSVQTAIAESRQAEQKRITVEQQGQAAAAEAKWKQEVIKAQQVTEAEAKLAVATLGNQTAEQYRQETLKRADADASYRRQVMAADGALQQKLTAYVQVNQAYAAALKDIKTPIVPGVVFGNNGGSTPSANALIDLLTAKTAGDLGIRITGNQTRD